VLKAIAFGEWTPDLAASNSPHLTIAQNVRPIANGYAPVGDFLSVAGDLGAAFVGGGAFTGSDGNTTLLAATAAKLRKYTGSWADVLSVATTKRWYFAQFGDNVCYANGGQVGSYGLITGTAAVIAGAPTNAIDIAQVKDVVMALTADSQAKWCDINNSANWTTGQAGNQPLLDGGTGVRIIGGENAIILQKNAIRRVSYTGATNTWWQFDVISREVGCMAAGSACAIGQIIFFLSERGFEMCDRQSVIPISDEKFNRWFFSNYSRADIANIWSAVDPRRNEVLWAMPGSPGIIIIYNWELKRGSYIQTNVSGLFTGLTSAISIDALDAIYGNLDAIPISLDDPSLSGGNPLLLVVNSSNVIGSLSGTNLVAKVRQENIELTPGKRSRLRNIRPVTDALSASASVNVQMRAGDAESLVSATQMGATGKMPLRANGRYFDNTLTIPAGTTWSYLQGCEYEFEPGDAR
jgi:hypothetical protein